MYELGLVSYLKLVTAAAVERAVCLLLHLKECQCAKFRLSAERSWLPNTTHVCIRDQRLKTLIWLMEDGMRTVRRAFVVGLKARRLSFHATTVQAPCDTRARLPTEAGRVGSCAKNSVLSRLAGSLGVSTSAAARHDEGPRLTKVLLLCLR